MKYTWKKSDKIQMNSKILHKYLEIKDSQEKQHNSKIFQYL